MFHVAVWYVLRIATAGLGDSYGERPQPSTLLSFRLQAAGFFHFNVKALNSLSSHIPNIRPLGSTIDSRLRCPYTLGNNPLGQTRP